MSEAKDLEFGQEARTKMMAGVTKLAKAVKATLGPRGRFAIIQRRNQEPHITKDGVSTARAITLKDPLEDLGAQVVRQASSKSADQAGDGTTTSAVLAEAILVEGLRLVAADHDPMSLKRGIDKATEKVVEELKKQSREVSTTEEIKQIATISANGDQMVGSMISAAMEAVGKKGIVSLEDGKGRESTLRVTTGFEFDRGYTSPHFINDLEKQRVVFESKPDVPVKVLLIPGSVGGDPAMQDMMPVLEYCSKNGFPLLVIAENVEGAVLGTLAVNNLRGSLKCVAVRSPGFGDTRTEMMSDLAVLTGAKLRDPATGDELLAGLSPDELGEARKVIVTKESTIVVGCDGREEVIKQRAKEVQTSLEQEPDQWDRERQEKRLAKLVGGVAVIEAGAPTEVQMQELKDRFEDALAATRAAVAEGVVPGGGVALARAAAALKEFTTGNKEEDAGVRVLLKAVSEPLKQIAVNAGQNGEVILNQVLADPDQGVGFNAATLEVTNLPKAGIIDPTKVSRVALETAASVAGVFLCTEAAITYAVDEEDHSHQRRGM